ncbi:hypothetical protein CH363_09795 [Leptospira haakeii]|uniref:Uncharacterized protein n=1 Tax=Leptospira haakeii TaxID=2023198 RepID=A0ABX4PKV2_9LEPT|nr:hypothetical protein CH363_09795 [Leptospira haakeii]PKA19718.1 hypothetical protein CH377_10050 [Leptospira haakeii]
MYREFNWKPENRVAGVKNNKQFTSRHAASIRANHHSDNANGARTGLGGATSEKFSQPTSIASRYIRLRFALLGLTKTRPEESILIRATKIIFIMKEPCEYIMSGYQSSLERGRTSNPKCNAIGNS